MQTAKAGLSPGLSPGITIIVIIIIIIVIVTNIAIIVKFVRHIKFQSIPLL